MSSSKNFYTVNQNSEPKTIKKLFAINNDKTPLKVHSLYAIDENHIPHLIYKGSILLTNLLKNTAEGSSQFDIAGHSGEVAICSAKVVAGHTYLLRGTSRRYRPPDGITHTSQLRITAPGINKTFATNKVNQYWGYEAITDETKWEKILIQPNAAGTLIVYFKYAGRAAAAGDMVSSTAWCSTIVDVTELVADLGENPTASEVWTALGGTNFFGSREVELS